MKRAILFLTFIFITALCFSQQVFVAVAPFEAKDGISASNAMTITEIFGIELQATGKVRVVSRTNFDAAMKEHRFQLGDLSDEKKTAQLGKALNANWVTRGQVQKLGSLIVITATLMDVNTMEIVGGAPMYLNKIEEAPEKMPAYMETIKQRINMGGSVYKVGDFGPAGGIVFYDKGTFSNGWRYLEAAPAETEFHADWGAYKKNVGSTNTAVGSGKRNTEITVEGLKTLGESGKAAQLCVALNYDGFSDWFLPSKDELDLMYKNLKQKGLGGFSDGRYWSSSRSGSERLAWNQRFRDGNKSDDVGYSLDDFPDWVRAIRAF